MTQPNHGINIIKSSWYYQSELNAKERENLKVLSVFYFAIMALNFWQNTIGM